MKLLKQPRVIGFVIRTGFSTHKGGFFRNVLHPKDLRIDFYFHAYFFIFIYFLLSIAGLIIQIKMSQWTNLEIIIGFLDLITVIVPPILPSAMILVMLFSFIRFKRIGIICLDARKIINSGRINLICFDKTGTITDPDFKLENMIINSNSTPKALKVYNHSNKDIIRGERIENKSEDNIDIRENLILVKECMATCHFLIPNKNNEKFEGDPLEFEMFKHSNFDLAYYGELKNQSSSITKFPYYFQSKGKNEIYETLEIKEIYEFHPTFNRMSTCVIRKDENSTSFLIFSKGSPSKILDICSQDSIPADVKYKSALMARDGKKVIALAYKKLQLNEEELSNLERTDVESNLQFLGFLIFENKINQDSINTIRRLKEANLETIMITGDVIEAATHVSIESEILNKYFPIYSVKLIEQATNNLPIRIKFSKDVMNNYELKYEKEIEINEKLEFSYHPDFDIFNAMIISKYQFVISSDVIRLIYRKDPFLKSYLAKKIIERGFVFADMNFDDKANLIEMFQNLKYVVAMCGDGSNDIKALNQADIGISFNNAQASLGSSFTSEVSNISVVLKVLIEGRAALTNTIEIFKFISLYSIIQFLSLIILNTISSQLTDNQLLVEDMVIILPVTFFISFTGPSKKLSNIEVVGSLFSKHILISVLGHIFFILGSQIGLFYLTQNQSFYSPFIYNEDLPSNDNRNIICHLNSALFLVSIFQIIGLSATFSFGSKFREPIYSNIGFIIIFPILFAIACIALLINHYDWVSYLFNLKYDPPFPIEYKLILLVWFLVNIAICILYEQFVINKIILKENERSPIKNAEIQS